MIYLVKMSRDEASDAYRITVYDTESKKHLITVVEFKGEYTPENYSKVIGDMLTAGINIMQKGLNNKPGYPIQEI